MMIIITALCALILATLIPAVAARTARTRATASTAHADACNRHVDTLAELSRRDTERARVAPPAEARALRLIVAARFAASYCAHKR